MKKLLIISLYIVLGGALAIQLRARDMKLETSAVFVGVIYACLEEYFD